MSTEIQEHSSEPTVKARAVVSRLLNWRTGIALAALLSIVSIWHASAHKRETVAEIDNLPVAVVKVGREDLAKELMVPAEFRPYQEVDIHAKVAGFLEKINVDIGDRVEAGQVLAVLEITELQDDLKRARAIEQRSAEEVKHAESAYEEAHVVFTRLTAVDKSQPHLVAQQELDAAEARDHQADSGLAAARQQVEVARAETSKLNTMVKYSRITAPFPGVITKRSADPGALIPAGTSWSAQAMPLLRLSQIDRLRLVFPVSISYVSEVNIGTPVEIRVQNIEKTLLGKVARISRKIETATRTMDVELDVPNPDFTLIPGMYASVVIKLERRDHTLSLPIEAVARGSAPTVFLVDTNHQIEERSVKLGLETPTRLEVLAGLQENDLVMMGSRAQVKPGQKVEPRLLAAEKE